MTNNSWKESSIGEICKFTNGRGFTPAEWSDRGLPIIRIQNLNGSTDFNYYEGEPEEKWVVMPDDILFAWAGTRGVSFGATIWKGPKGVLNQHIYRIHPNTGIDRNWLYYALEVVTSRIEKKAHGFKSTLLHVQKADITRQVVTVPPLVEQSKIAALLSIWEEGIEKTEKLIAAKVKRKRGLMQQLLTGKKRFQEFEGQDWQRVRIADLFEEVWRYEKWDENALYNLVSIRRRGGGLFSRGALLGQQIKVKKLKSLRTGDFLISKRQVVHGAWGLVTSEYNGTMVSDEYDSLVVKNSNQLSVEFFTHLSRLPLIRRMAALACNGVHIEKLIFDWDDFSKNLIFIPSSVEEQRRISAVLDSCNKEIELLQQQLDALKRQKRGLMQKLLTGQIRVKVDDLEAAVVEAFQ